MNKLMKSVLSVSAATIVATASLAPVAVNAWGDSDNGRKSLTTAEAKTLGDTITFNSFTDGKIGDEKNFVGAKVSSVNADTWNADTINVKDGETYTIRLYVHNNNLYGTKNIAKDVKATFSLPTTVVDGIGLANLSISILAIVKRFWFHLLSAMDNIILLLAKE